jgi:hypothetical protein
MNYLFITGMSRSGTTLLDKILCNHKDLSVLSQPFPFVYLQAKKDFFKEIRHPEKTYFLNNLFLEDRYNLHELNRFLGGYKINKSKLNKIFNNMSGYSGQLTKIDDPDAIVGDVDSNAFIDVIKDLLKRLKHKENVIYCGAKEILCEEFLDFFMRNSIKTILLVRDPRDMVVSTYFGKFHRYMGKSRPLLFHLRNWRKSVAFAAHLSGKSNFKLIRYEDLVRFSEKTLKEITQFLEIDPFSYHFFSVPLKDQNGELWKGNSSFDKNKGINQNSCET